MRGNRFHKVKLSSHFHRALCIYNDSPVVMKKPTGNSPSQASSSAAVSTAAAKAPIEASNNASPMYTERLRKLYAMMLRGRMLLESSEAFPKKLRRAQLEACEVGLGYHLAADDLVAPSSRDFMIDLARGRKLSDAEKQMTARSPGQESKHDRSKIQPSSLAIAGDAPAQLAIATGMAAVCKMQDKSDVTVAVSAFQGKLSEFPAEALRFAAENSLGIIYVLCTDWNSPLKLREASLACDVPGIIVDGKDVVAVYRVAEESVRRARQRMGPTLIDCRLEPRRDPLKVMEEYLRRRSLWSPAWKQDLESRYAVELEQVRGSAQ